MTNWMLRGLAFAAAMVVLRLFQGALINAWQMLSGLISLVLLLLFAIGGVVWGVMDGRADAKASPDPDRRQDLAMTWLLAGLVAGALSGAVAWLISLFYKAIYTGGPINELTTFAAFTALIVFLVGIVGVAVGRWLVDRSWRRHRCDTTGLPLNTSGPPTPMYSPPFAPTTVRPGRCRSRSLRHKPRPSPRSNVRHPPR
ncbi:transmembrane protein [Mycobacterium tuberculosis]|nr:transmembrane protein [Mycobacterium tuberculosis]CKZ19730.1 transmembrane protein [Mycobacterium tuberculosis]